MKDYNPKKPSKLIIYLDMNKLSGWEMTEYLPYGGFKWLKKVDEFDLNSINKKNLIGYILESDLEYPDELHALHNNYRLAPEKRAVFYEMLSNYCKKIADKCKIKVGDAKKEIFSCICL